MKKYDLRRLCYCRDDSLTDNWIDSTSAESALQDVVVWSMLWEATNPNWWMSRLQKTINQTKKQNAKTKIILLLNSWYRPYQDTLANLNCQIIFVDFFLLLVYQRLIINKESKLASWNPSTGKFLFLTGKCAKLNRIRLLYKFYQQQLLTNAEWSLFADTQHYEKYLSLLPEITNNELIDFINLHNGSPDKVKPVTLIKSLDMHYNGIPYDVSMYNRTSFQVISETIFDSKTHPWITEKTWLAIINRQPFIMASSQGTLKRLKDLGFKTFEEYLPCSYYDTIQDSELRLNAIVDNTAYWTENIKKHQNQIQLDVDYNYSMLIKLANDNFKNVQAQLIDSGVSLEVEAVIDLVDNVLDSLFVIWYESIKDPLWPDCKNHGDFWKLPNYIQQECIDIHGYCPQ